MADLISLVMIVAMVVFSVGFIVGAVSGADPFRFALLFVLIVFAGLLTMAFGLGWMFLLGWASRTDWIIYGGYCVCYLVTLFIFVGYMSRTEQPSSQQRRNRKHSSI